MGEGGSGNRTREQDPGGSVAPLGRPCRREAEGVAPKREVVR